MTEQTPAAGDSPAETSPIDEELLRIRAEVSQRTVEKAAAKRERRAVRNNRNASGFVAPKPYGRNRRGQA